MSVAEAERRGGVLTRAASGDEAAFAQIVSAYHADMCRVAFVIAGDLDTADDAVQQAWQIAWRKLGTVRDAHRLRSWLVAVAANEARQLVRRRRRRREVELEPGWHDGFGVSSAPEVQFLDLTRALRQLSPEDRALLAMRYVAGMNATEIADVTGGSPSGVRSRMARLLARLREDLSDV